ncbi:MAG: bis(5'-nucleosyl)-tetraphosphatase (symmetrical) YqeK [Rubrobacteraceae bacterium]
MTQRDLLHAADDFTRRRISPKRYTHTLGVADTAEHLATLHGIDPERARLAALLHDAARELKPEDLLRLAKEWSPPVGESERQSPKLLHGPVAADLVKRELGIEDEGVLEAIRVHTTGKPEMGPLALILFVADKIEPGRDYPSVGHLRELAERDLRKAAAGVLRRAIDYNRERSTPTHPSTLETLEWLEES